MAQTEIFFRPPSEAESFIVRVMHGCPHNACTFCSMFKDIPCKVLPLEEVLDSLETDARYLGPRFIPKVQSMYLEGGDPLAIGSKHLLSVMNHARRLYPGLDRFACYATARFTIKKKPAELSVLAKAGLRRVYVGLESGLDTILESAKKGCTSADLMLAGKMLADAGIEMDVSILLGIGGKRYSSAHALMTAQLLDALEPDCVRIRTFVPKAGTELGADYLQGNFVLMGPHEILQELYQMVEHMHGKTRLLSEHWTDFIFFDAQMPLGKAPLLALIQQHLELPESSFRAVGLADSKD